MPEYQIGDLLEIKRKWYSHWAVFAGNGNVIHITCNLSKSSCNVVKRILKSCLTKTVVRCEKLKDVAGPCEVIVNNFLDDQFMAKCREEILQTAQDMLGKEGYSILFGNCESFANFCRYGEPVSFQITNVLKLLLALRLGISVGRRTTQFLENKIGIIPATVAGVTAGAVTVYVLMNESLVEDFIISLFAEAGKHIMLSIGLAGLSNIALGACLCYLVWEVVSSEYFKDSFNFLGGRCKRFLTALYDLFARIFRSG